MRFGTVELEQSWQQKLERELMVTENDHPAIATTAQAAASNDRVQFGLWAESRTICFQHEASD